MLDSAERSHLRFRNEADVAQPPITEGTPMPAPDAPSTDWHATLPTSLRDDPSLRDIRDVAALAKSYVHAQRMVGADRVAVPGRNATPEDWSVLFDRLGRPRSPADYAFERPDTGDLPYDEALESEFRAKAHQLGLLPQQAAGLYRWWLDSTLGAFRSLSEDAARRRDEAEAALRSEWGPGYDANLDAARRTLRRFGDEDLYALMADEVGNNPALLRFCARIGAMMAEDRLAGASVGGTMTPAGEARRKIAEVLADRHHPYFNNRDPRHEQAVDDVRSLFETAYGPQTEQRP